MAFGQRETTPEWWMTPEGSGNYPGAGLWGDRSGSQYDAFLGVDPLDILEQEPEVAYWSFSNEWGRSPNQKRYYENQFGNMLNVWKGELGRQLRAGQPPTGRFTDYLSDFDWTEEFRSLPPSQRGAQTGRFAPPVRWKF